MKITASIFTIAAFALQFAVINCALAGTVTVNDMDELAEALKDGQGSGKLVINLVRGKTYKFVEPCNDGINVDYSEMLPLITTDVTINGNGGTIEYSLEAECMSPDCIDYRLFYISGGKLTLDDLTLKQVGSWLLSCEHAQMIINRGSLVIDSCLFADFKGSQSCVIYSEGDLDIRDSSFIDNSSDSASVVFASGGVATIENSVFEDNYSSDSNGGAIYSLSGIMSIKDSIFTGNSAKEGGAIYGDYTKLEVHGSTFANNHAKKYGGAIGVMLPELFKVSGSTFEANYSKDIGGAIHFLCEDHVYAVPWVPSDSQEGDLQKEGVNVYPDFCEISRSTFYKNETATGGGAIHGTNAAKISNSTFTGNSTLIGSGGAILTDGGTMLENVIIAGNSATNGPNIAVTVGDGLYFINGSNVIGAHDFGLIKLSENGNVITVADDSELHSLILDDYVSRPDLPGGGHFPLLCSHNNLALDSGDCDPNHVDQLGNAATGTCDLGAVEAVNCNLNGANDGDESAGDQEDKGGDASEGDGPDDGESAGAGDGSSGCSLNSNGHGPQGIPAICYFAAILFLVLMRKPGSDRVRFRG